MIQFNLLPDVKLQYIKARRQKRLALLISSIVAITAVTVFVLLFGYVRIIQTKYSNDLSKDIKTNGNKLKAKKNLNKMFTVQSQLKTLPTLHTQKPAVIRTFEYIQQLTPANVSINDYLLDFTAGQITVNGGATDLNAINIFADTMKYTGYTIKGEDEGKRAFSKVVLSSFSATQGSVTYSITYSFDPVIFDDDKDVDLVVPNIITTRLQSNDTSAIFQALPKKTGN